jgi:hypothetical protein
VIYAFSSFGVKQLRQSEDDADKVVWTALIISLLHSRRDLVVGLGDGVFEANGGRIVPPCAERIDACHLEGLAPD